MWLAASIVLILVIEILANDQYKTENYVSKLNLKCFLIIINFKILFLFRISKQAYPYSFAYAVKDDYTYNDFGHSENSDGKVVAGSYQVLLPGYYYFILL